MYTIPYEPNVSQVLAFVIGFVTVAAVVAAAIAIVMYVFEAIAMFSISRRRRLGLSAFAWIPILNWFKLGQIADDAVYHKRGVRSHFMVLMPVFEIVSFVLSGIGSFLISISYNLNSVDISTMPFRDIEGFAENIASSVATGPFTAGLIILLVGYILGVVASVMVFICLYHIYKSCVSNYVVFFVFSLIFPVTIPFFLFAVRKKDNPEFYKIPAPVQV